MQAQKLAKCIVIVKVHKTPFSIGRIKYVALWYKV